MLVCTSVILLRTYESVADVPYELNYELKTVAPSKLGYRNSAGSVNKVYNFNVYNKKVDMNYSLQILLHEKSYV
jgi:hypothetical protein